jgi:methylated-DNA-[protein]-cysteine S-methyltransferase
LSVFYHFQPFEVVLNRNSELLVEISTHPGLSAPFSPLWAAASAEGLLHFSFGIIEEDFLKDVRARWKNARFTHTARPHPVLQQVLEYLADTRRSFNIEIDLSGFTPFQQAVYRAVQLVPYGQTASYAQIAIQIGKPRAARAVGAANAANPLPLIIPCHRLVGAGGGLRGYGGTGGIETKAWLLAFESRNMRT